MAWITSYNQLHETPVNLSIAIHRSFVVNKEQQKTLIALIDKFSNGDGVHSTAMPGLKCLKTSAPSMKMPVVYEPCLCLIVQGVKEVMLGDEIYRYAPSEFLVASVDLPATGQVIQASIEEPYLCLQVSMDLREISDLVSRIDKPIKSGASSRRGLFVGKADEALVDSIVRLAKLLEMPEDIDFLAPMLMREMCYRLLKSPYGHRVAQLAVSGSSMQRIAHAIEFLKLNFDKAICMTDVVDLVNMSPSSFHSHFKQVTAMSPLQYQKHLRLLEARRIMLTEAVDASHAAYRVGYESPSQFSREYSRMFGLPPIRDVEGLRGGTH